MEYIDVLDENGKPTGITKTIRDIHLDGDLHRSAEVWIVNSKGELILQQRSPSKPRYPNLWDISAAGHLSTGQSSIEAAMRETEEELGLRLPADKFEYLFTNRKKIRVDANNMENEFEDVYLVQLDFDLSKLTIQKEEVEEVRSVHYKNLERAVANNDKTLVPHGELYDRLFVELHRRYP